MNTSTPSTENRSPGEPPPGTILAPSPLLTLTAFLIGVGIEWIWPTSLLPWTWNLLLGIVLVGAGSGLFGGALWTMRRHGKHPAHSDDPPGVITDGPFRYSRNPIYVGHSLMHAGGSFLIGSLWPLITLVPVLLYLRRVVEREEARLAALFGAEYERYCRNVRRWL